MKKANKKTTPRKPTADASEQKTDSSALPPEIKAIPMERARQRVEEARKAAFNKGVSRKPE